MNLAVDIGNTTSKLGLFDGRELVSHHVVDSLDSDSIPNHAASILSASGVPEGVEKLHNVFMLGDITDFPLEMNYETLETLGHDRIANACATIALEGDSFLIVDAGSCITYDLVLDGVFHGGAISPGLDMRFQAMNNFTARLPLTHIDGPVAFPAKTTDDNLRVGVFEGIVGEMNRFIALSREDNEHLKVILTGGNYALFANALKSSTFADPKLTLRGLNEILLHLSN